MATAAQSEAVPVAKSRDLWRLGDAGALLAYACAVLWTLQYHEKWADEAQAWLIARDLDLRTIWFHELRYEGSPGLWHSILWIAQHVFHARYGALGYIGAAFAIAGAAVLLFLAPFPRYVRWPLAFTYVMVYQYAVIARPYTLFPLLAFLAAYFFQDTAHPVRMTVILALLALLSLHGTILAGCFALCYAIKAFRFWGQIATDSHRTNILCAAALALIFVFVAAILKPTPDVAEFASSDVTAPPPGVFQFIPGKLDKFEAVFSGAFLDYIAPSLVFVVLAGWWFYQRSRFLEFALPITLLGGLYVFIHGSPHHHGTLFVAAVAAFWVAWPSGEWNSEGVLLHPFAQWLPIGLLLILSAVNILDAAVVIKREYLYPYSGGMDAASYLKSVGADRTPMFGFLHGVVAIQAYFDHNILSNVHTAYFHHGLPAEGVQLDLQQLHSINPLYIVAYSNEPRLLFQYGIPMLQQEGYEVVHFSDGYYLYKRSVYQREAYLILRRKGELAPK